MAIPALSKDGSWTFVVHAPSSRNPSKMKLSWYPMIVLFAHVSVWNR
jgi:hypothetical protein